MSAIPLVAALLLMSMALAIESSWLKRKLQPSTFFNQLGFSYISKILQLIYFIGLPYLALISGLIPARLFGLKGWDTLSATIADMLLTHSFGNWQPGFIAILQLWLPDIGVLVNIFIGFIGIGLFFGWFYLRENSAIPLPFPSKLQSIFDLIHWGFYRAILWRITGDLYSAVLGSVLLLLIEYLLVYKMGVKDSDTVSQMAIRFGGNTIVAIGFLFAPNLWVAGMLYLLVLQGTIFVFRFYPSSS